MNPKQKFFRFLFPIFLAIGCVGAHAEERTPGGALRESISSYERIQTRRGSDNDASSAAILIGFVSGNLSVHRENGTKYAMVVASLDDKPTTTKSELLKIAELFTPLLNLPDSVSNKQAISILKKYLDENPSKWNESSNLLIQMSLAQEYPLKK